MHAHFPNTSRITFLLSLTLSSVTAANSNAQASSSQPAVEPVHLENLVVTASPFSRDQAELASATNVLAGQKLLFAQQSSLGATLDGQPGIASTYFGPGASRPVIRGLGGDRVRVLNNGTGVADASVASPDHAVAIEPLLARRIEVVRGPATLLYGSNAVGGIVNVMDDRIPAALPASAITGRAEGRYGSAAGEWAGVAALDGALGNSLAWHAEGLRRDAGDTRLPDGAMLANSTVRTTAFAGGLSFVSKNGYAGASARRFETDYGVVAEADVTIHLVEKSCDFSGELTRAFGIFSGARAKFTAADYAHTEYEDAEPGAVFKNKALEGRVEFLHEKLAGRLHGSWGAQYTRSDFAALGEEAFLPPSRTQNAAMFLFEELPLRPVPLTLQFGARVENQGITTAAARRTDGMWSASLGGVLAPGRSKNWVLTATFARSERAPNAQELFADGPHAGTHAYEIGDANLAHEKSLGLDIGLRKKKGRLTGALTAFVNRFDDFIFEQSTGMMRDELPEYAYVQHGATFSGAELEMIFHLHESTSHTLDLEITADAVRAENRDAHASLPRITPRRAGIALEYRGPVFSGGIGVRTAERARRLAPSETPTAGYGLLGAHAAWRVRAGNRAECELFLQGANLADQEARNHASLLKDIAPLPGRNVTAGVRFVF